MESETSLPVIPPEVAGRLGYYVYLYVDPRDGRIFYVGKGQGQRVLAHLSATGDARKTRHIAELRALGLMPRLEVLAHKLPSEETAFRIEAAAIDLLGLDSLANEVRGWQSVELGRLSLSQLVAYYAAKPVIVEHPALLIRNNRLYRHDMDEASLYDGTRGVWKLSERREKASLALAVFEGVVREAYRIEEWHQAGTTVYTTGRERDERWAGRWEFTGAKAEEATRSLYVDRSVASYFKQGQQNPVVYVGC